MTDLLALFLQAPPRTSPAPSGSGSAPPIYGYIPIVIFFLIAVLLPVALLLSLLFALGRMSRANEIVSMLTSGVSLPRILLPLMGIGLLTVAASMALNYSLAPHAELARKNFISEAQARPGRNIQGQVFRNRTDLRTWFIQNFRLGDNLFNNVQVLQQDAQRQKVRRELVRIAMDLGRFPDAEQMLLKSFTIAEQQGEIAIAAVADRIAA